MTAPAAKQPRKRATAAQLNALEEAFRAWAGDHGMIWFDNDAVLAERLSVVLGIRIDWSEGNALALEESQ